MITVGRSSSYIIVKTLSSEGTSSGIRAGGWGYSAAWVLCQASLLRMQVAASVNLGKIKGREESLKSRWRKNDQAPTRAVPVEAGRSGSGESGPKWGSFWSTGDGSWAVTKCYVPTTPATAKALRRSTILNNILLSSIKTVVVKMQYFIFSLFHVNNILKIELFVLIFMDKCFCLKIVSH